MTDNIKKIKNQHNYIIENYPKFDDKFSLFKGNKYPLQVVTVSPKGGKKHRTTIVSGLTCMWYSGAKYSMIKRKHTKHYEPRMRSNKV